MKQPNKIIAIVKEHETKTIFVNENHLKPTIKNRILLGKINPYNITLYSLTQKARDVIRRYHDLGFKSVFIFGKKNVLLTYNK